MQNNQDLLGKAVAGAASAFVTVSIQGQLHLRHVCCASNDRVLNGTDGKDLKKQW